MNTAQAHPSPAPLRGSPAFVARQRQDERRTQTEYLPFTVRVVQSDEDLKRAIAMRYEAYARHMPDFAEQLRQPERDDFEADSIVLLAESKLDGSVIGTMRIQNNSYRRLNMEHSIALPQAYQGQAMVEVRRLGVAKGAAGRLVKMVLIKACLLYCEKNNIQWAMVAARPPLDQSYEKLLFIDVMPGETFTPLPKAGNVPHRVMAFEIDTCEQRFAAQGHPLLRFFCHTAHADINVDRGTEWRPRGIQHSQAHTTPELVSA